VVTPSRPAGKHRSAAGTKLRKGETSSPAVTAVKSPSHVGRESKQPTHPKVMFTGVVADNAQKVTLDALSVNVIRDVTVSSSSSHCRRCHSSSSSCN